MNVSDKFCYSLCCYLKYDLIHVQTLFFRDLAFHHGSHIFISVPNGGGYFD